MLVAVVPPELPHRGDRRQEQASDYSGTMHPEDLSGVCWFVR
jgi:hypothetical protein